MSNGSFGKTMENVRKHRGIKLVATERWSNYLVTERNYHTTKFFTENLLVTEMKKTTATKEEMLINKPVCLRVSILELSKILIYEFWYDYLKPKYGGNAKLSYTDTDRFIVHVKTDDIYKNIAEDVETRYFKLWIR